MIAQWLPQTWVVADGNHTAGMLRLLELPGLWRMVHSTVFYIISHATEQYV